jgi:hypothetical protein
MLRGVAEMIRRGRLRWEENCRRCGQCCFEKDNRAGVVVINFRAPCRFLDESTRLCTVYENRFTMCRDCHKMTILHALFVSYLPESCGYVRRYRRWTGARASVR